jgi:hypothetical protein
MKDLSVLGKIYLGGSLGRETRTGLSRLKGGRCCGSKVCCFFTTFGTDFFWSMPGNDICMATFPSTVVKEKSLFGAVGPRGFSF